MLFGDDTSSEQRETILLCIQPPYYQRIVDGLKHYEYRRIFKKCPIDAFIYVTSPISQVQGFIRFGDPIIDSVDRICKIAEDEAPGSTEGMKTYMQGLSTCFAIPINEFHPLEPAITLTEIRALIPKFHPPMSYMVLDKKPELLQFLQQRREQ